MRPHFCASVVLPSECANRGIVMKRLCPSSLSAVFAALIALQCSFVHAATFSYHGSLQDSGKAAEGSYDLELTLYTSPNGGSAVAGPLRLYKVLVHAGSFSTEADFGPLAKSLEQAWLDVKVRPAGNADFVSLSTCAAVSTNGVTEVCPGAWTLDGNAGTASGTGLGQNYLGTADNQPLVLAVNRAQAGRLAPTPDLPYADATTVILGAAGNFVGSLGGATIGGGGTALVSNCGATADQPCVNQATGRFATVAGGIGSAASADGSTVSGGSHNSAIGYVATVSGGLQNYAAGQGAFIGAGFGNSATGDASVIGGGENNSATGFSATVGGGGLGALVCGPGGDQLCANSATNLYATVGGGIYNRAFGSAATVGGGNTNFASVDYATISGGYTNTAGGQYSFVGGGTTNQAVGYASSVPGGGFNQATGSYSSVVGGSGNTAGGTFSSTGSGANNSAGGDWSYAAGFNASVRNATAAASPANCGSNNTCGDLLTFVWSDGTVFTSTGSQQFLVEAGGGIGLNTNAPAANRLTVAGPAGAVSSGFTTSTNTIAMFENNTAGYIETLVPAANETGTLFSLIGKVADGGIVYNSSANLNGLTLRTNGSVDRMRITSAGATQNTTGSWTTFSDFRLKRDIEAIDHPLDTLLGLHGQSFEYIDPPSAMAQPGRRMGFIAQDVEKVLPQWVGEDDRGYKMVTPTGFEALSVEALRELRAEKDAEIEVLQNRLDALSERLGKLEAAKGR
jgi:Chaperone of endosialidase